MNEATTIARPPRAAQAPNAEVLFLPYRLGPFTCGIASPWRRCTRTLALATPGLERS